jgi:hypothetical protein
MPYAVKALIKHKFDVDHLDIWLTFKNSMNIKQKPDESVWLVAINGTIEAVTSSKWLDMFTLQLTVIDVNANPDTVTVAYDGPDPLLTTTWGKQWEPWGEIRSFDGWPHGVKKNMIVIWYGNSGNVPTGWHICDGSDELPAIEPIAEGTIFIIKL